MVGACSCIREQALFLPHVREGKSLTKEGKEVKYFIFRKRSLKKGFSAGCSKMLIPPLAGLRSEAYLDVRRNDEG